MARPQDDMTAKLSRDSLWRLLGERARLTLLARHSEKEKKKKKDRRTTPIVVEHGQCFIRALSMHNITQLARSAVPSF